MTNLKKISELEGAMLAFFKSTTSNEHEETGEYRFALAMEALIAPPEGGDLGFAWLCMMRSANLGFAQANHTVKQVLVDNNPIVEVLGSVLTSCAKDFMRWKYDEYYDYKVYIDSKIKNKELFLGTEESAQDIYIDEHVLITFEIFMENLLSESAEYYKQLNSKYKTGQLDKKLESLNGITDMADLYNKFYDF
jgi:hypothetical protein